MASTPDHIISLSLRSLENSLLLQLVLPTPSYESLSPCSSLPPIISLLEDGVSLVSLLQNGT